MTASLTVTHPVTGEKLPPFLTVLGASALLGRSEKWVKNQCQSGGIPALPREGRRRWSIPTGRLLEVVYGGLVEREEKT
ncbi:MAG: hypothetical protein ACRDYZ_00735 [Acidimicrobiales bacterium]